MTPPRDTPYPMDKCPMVSFGVYGRLYFNILQHTVAYMPLNLELTVEFMIFINSSFLLKKYSTLSVHTTFSKKDETVILHCRI